MLEIQKKWSINGRKLYGVLLDAFPTVRSNECQLYRCARHCGDTVTEPTQNICCGAQWRHTVSTGKHRRLEGSTFLRNAGNCLAVFTVQQPNWFWVFSNTTVSPSNLADLMTFATLMWLCRGTWWCSWLRHCATVAYPGIFFGGRGSTNSVEDRENGDLGVVAP